VPDEVAELIASKPFTYVGQTDIRAEQADAGRTPQEFAALQARGEQLGLDVLEAVRKQQLAAPRTLQSDQRILGPSELGGCREYIRASIKGDPKAPAKRVKWAAFLGTVTGDAIEDAVRAQIPGAVTQERVTATLPSGMRATGSLDIRMGRDAVVDLKSKSGITDIMGEGPSLKHLIQISSYLVGAMQADLVDPDAYAALLYFDRSGDEKRMYSFVIDIDDAWYFLGVADKRLDEVAEAMAAGTSQSYLRDEPESWCYHTECPFYQACWGSEDYNPTGKITDARSVEALTRYDKLRAIKKIADAGLAQAKAQLFPDQSDERTKVEGITNSGLQLKWRLKENASGFISYVIDVRQR
jgi:hypothetical protein